jgi:hypothetical protein
MRFQQGRPEGRKGLQCVLQCGFGVVRAGVTAGFGLAPSLADNTIMGINHRIGKDTAPFEGADREDGQAAVARDIPQIPGEVALPLTTKTGNAVRWHICQNALVQCNAPQEFQPVEQAVHIGRVLAHLKLAQPDKATDGTSRVVGQKGIKPVACDTIQKVRNPGINPPFRGNKCIRTKPLDDRDPRQNRLSHPALLDKAPCQILVCPGRFSRTLQPDLEVARPSACEHLVAVEFAQGCQVLMPGFFAGCISGQIIRPQSELRGQKAGDCQGDDLVRRQQPSRISQSAKLQSEAKTIVGTAAGADDFQIIVRKGVMAQHRCFVRRQIEQRRPLAVRQDGAMRHVSFAFQIWFRYL